MGQDECTRQHYCSTLVLGHMAAVHYCGYEVGLSVQKASQCAHYQRGSEEGGRRRSSKCFRSVEARGAKQGNLCFLLSPLESRFEQALLPPCPFLLYLLLFYPYSALIY